MCVLKLYSVKLGTFLLRHTVNSTQREQTLANASNHNQVIIIIIIIYGFGI